MALILCPECQADVSDRAVHCPRCGCPMSEVPVRLPNPKPPKLGTYITTRFALLWTAGAVVVGPVLMVAAMEGGDESGVFAAFVVLASLLPIWWKTRRAARQAAAPIMTAELERKVEERLKDLEANIRGQLGDMEDNTRRVLDLEERLEFTERLLTKYRDEQLGPG